MIRSNLDDLRSFLVVAQEQSFTKAAARLGVSQSALSHTIRELEARIGVRLLTRTTRSVSLTDAGERLVQGIGPRLEEVQAELDGLADFKERPAGTVRITAGYHAIRSILWPKLKMFLPRYPDIRVELATDNGLTDIVSERYDAGVRWGEQVTSGMIAMRIGPDIRFVVVGTDAYFSGRACPDKPQDLINHNCINLRLPTHGGLYAWEFAKDGREVKVRVDGQLIFNDIFQVLDGALAGLGMAYVPEDIARPHLNSGLLRCVLEDWCAPWAGYHLYYPDRRRPSLAFGLLLEALRHRE
jgi:DNA-binding transcriptional LysR family regulator